jgi:hypothetical protein
MADGTCNVDDCEAPAEKRGFCDLHYTRWRRHGDPLIVLRRHRAEPKPEPKPKPTFEQRFWARVAKGAPGECWEWTGAHADTGYAQVRANGRTAYAHRISYEMHKGPIPDGLHIDHLCRNRGCVNPAHMEAVTKKENDRRGMSPLGFNYRKTHCIRGHEFDSVNTYITSRGFRMCKACNRLRSIAAYRKRRMAA